VPHLIEPASSGRSKCRGCGARIEAGTLRFGESLPNPFAEGDTTQWFHLDCGAFKRPEPFLEALEAHRDPLDDRESLAAAARAGLEHRRLPRVNGVERASTARAQCRSCREAIAKDEWRIPLVYWEEGRFSPSGFIHVKCSRAYFETVDVLPRARRFGSDLSEEDLRQIQAELESMPA
jgi:Poly(ADP-ribose) polymerase and DNA-Ligase Zn-finger region